jgi:single-strand DNA-binding protein
MSLFQFSMLRSIQPMFVRTVKTAATPSPKKSAPVGGGADDDASFLGEAAAGGESDVLPEPSPSTGRERSLNRIQLIGRVGADPKVGGTERHKVVTFNLATNEYAGTNTTSGDVKQRVDWHRIAIFQPRLLDNAEKYIRQGDRLYIQGRLHHNNIRDKVTGQDRYVTSIIADDMIFLTKK